MSKGPKAGVEFSSDDDEAVLGIGGPDQLGTGPFHASRIVDAMGYERYDWTDVTPPAPGSVRQTQRCLHSQSLDTYT